MEFTEEQKAIINSKDKYLFANAGAGTGKTTTMMARVNHLIQDEGVAPHEILMCAFTRRDVAEMGKRFSNQTPSVSSCKINRNNHIRICTVDKIIWDLRKYVCESTGLSCETTDSNYAIVKSIYSLWKEEVSRGGGMPHDVYELYKNATLYAYRKRDEQHIDTEELENILENVPDDFSLQNEAQMLIFSQFHNQQRIDDLIEEYVSSNSRFLLENYCSPDDWDGAICDGGDSHSMGEYDYYSALGIVDGFCEYSGYSPLEILNDIYFEYKSGNFIVAFNEEEKETLNQLILKRDDLEGQINLLLGNIEKHGNDSDIEKVSALEEELLKVKNKIEFMQQNTNVLPSSIRDMIGECLYCYQAEELFQEHITGKGDEMAFVTEHKFLPVFILEALQKYGKTEKVIEKMFPDIKYIFIDEAQDFNYFNFDLFKTIADVKDASVSMFGDPDQCIYRWRGADPEYFVNVFLKKLEGCVVYPLTKNYRMKNKKLEELPNYVLNGLGSQLRISSACQSTENDVDLLALQSFKWNDKQKELYDKTNSFLMKPKSTEEQCVVVSSMIKEIIREDPTASIAILYRKRTGWDNFITQLPMQGIRCFNIGDFRDEIDNCLQVMGNEIYCRYSTQGTTPKTPEKKLKMGWKLISLFKEIKSIMKECGTRKKEDDDEIYKLISRLNSVFYYDYNGMVTTLLRPIKIDEGIVSQYEKMQYTIRAYLSDIEQAISRNGGLNCVRLSTVHRFKGAESDYVFNLQCPLDGAMMIGLDEQKEPDAPVGKAVKEERNILYVALTRAQKANILVTSKREETPMIKERMNNLFYGLFYDLETNEQHQLFSLEDYVTHSQSEQTKTEEDYKTQVQEKRKNS